jgi:hypothetical protein
MEPVRFETMAAEYSRAFRSARTAKNLLVLFILLALLMQIGAFVLVHFVGVLNPTAEAAPAVNISASRPSGNETAAAISKVLREHGPWAPMSIMPLTTGPATAPSPVASATKPAAAAGNVEPVPARKLFLSLGASEWGTILCWATSVSKFVAMVFSFMLVFTLLLSLELSLLGRLGGVAGFVSAFFWSLLLLAMLIPWHEAIRMGLACGATHNLGELQADIQNLPAGAKGFSWTLAAFYCRFLVFPIIALAVLVLVQTKFAKGFRQMTTSTAMDAGRPG